MGRKRDIVLAALILLGIWEVSALLLNSMALPEPWLVLLDTAGKIADGSLLDDLAISALRALLGIGLALVTAVPLGLAVGAEEGCAGGCRPLSTCSTRCRMWCCCR